MEIGNDRVAALVLRFGDHIVAAMDVIKIIARAALHRVTDIGIRVRNAVEDIGLTIADDQVGGIVSACIDCGPRQIQFFHIRACHQRKGDG